MSKPPGVQFGVNADGLYLRVTPSDRVADAIYNAVEEALDAGWTVERFRREAAECWRLHLKARAESDARAWSTP